MASPKDAGETASVSRTMWEAVERFHALCYVAPEVRTEATAVGLKGFWMNYFSTRVAPVGPIGPEATQALFFYYGPQRVHRALPDAWHLAEPEQVIEARYRAMDQALRRTYGNDVATNPDVVEAAALIRLAVEGCDGIGRVLHAGWASLAWPTEAHLGLWHGCTLLREYRSGNHLMAVCQEGLDGCESVVSHVAVGGAPNAWIRDEAAWSETEESAAVASLRRRGWLDANGEITDAGVAGRGRIEALTDELDAPVWRRLGLDNGRRLFELLSSLSSALPPDDQLDWELHYADQ